MDLFQHFKEHFAFAFGNKFVPTEHAAFIKTTCASALPMRA